MQSGCRNAPSGPMRQSLAHWTKPGNKGGDPRDSLVMAQARGAFSVFSDADNHRIQSRSVRVVRAEDFSQWLPVDEAIGPLVQLITVGGTDTILKASGKRLVAPTKQAE